MAPASPTTSPPTSPPTSRPTPPATTRGPYAKTRRQRESIIQTALEYFGQFGYHGASMREIARAVGLSQAGLLHHFKSKDELLIATLETRDELSSLVARTAADASSNPLDGMIAVVEDNVAHPHLVRLFVVVSAEATDDRHPAHAFFTARTSRVIDHFRVALTDAVEEGLAVADLDVDGAARQCQAMMYGLQVQWLLDPSTDMVGTFRAFLTVLTRPELAP